MTTHSHTDQYCETVIPGLVKVDKLHETGTVLAYYARQPLWPVHVIVIPKQHITSLLDFAELEDEVVADIMKTIALVARQVSEAHGQCRVMTNVGEYQHTKHLHWHIYCESPTTTSSPTAPKS